MKTSKLAILLLSLLSITNSHLFEVADAAIANDPVLDIDGQELQAGVEYFVVSSIWGAGGGGLSLGKSPTKPCPEIIIQRRSGDHGTPVTFWNVNSTDNVVRLSTDVNIEQAPIRSRLCQTTTLWKLDDYDESTGKWWVTTDGIKENPSSWFKIEKTGSLGYKFRHCPTLCDTCRPLLCGDIGKESDQGQVRLALSEQSWSWVFIKFSKVIEQVVDAKQ